MDRTKTLIVNLLLMVRDSFARIILALIRPILIDMLDKANRMQQDNLSTAFMHQNVFPKYKNIHTGKDVAIIACGPTLKEYKPIEGVINIGVNRAYRDKRINLDYLFIVDGKCFLGADKDAIIAYRPGDCKKFFGLTNERSANNNWTTPENIANVANAERFRCDSIQWLNVYNPQFSYDLSTQPLADFESCIFSAIQFALWTNPRRIFLVGCDCTNNGHFYSRQLNNELQIKKLLLGYKQLRKFASAYYPDTEIISVNPVGLKGLFRDWYQSEEPCPPPRG